VELFFESPSDGLVINVEEVIVGPDPAAFVAETAAVYSVPGAKPVRLAVVVAEVNVVGDPVITGVTTTV
jgi:hypothetical protein